MPHHRTPANYDQSKVSATDVERAIRGAPYPTTKRDLADYARGHNVAEDVVGRIGMLPGDRYDSEDDVLTAFSRSQDQGKNKSMP